MKNYRVLSFSLLCIFISNVLALDTSTNNGLFSEDLFNRLFNEKNHNHEKNNSTVEKQKTKKILLTFNKDLATIKSIQAIEEKYQLKVDKYTTANEDLTHMKVYGPKVVDREICLEFQKIKNVKKCEITNP